MPCPYGHHACRDTALPCPSIDYIIEMLPAKDGIENLLDDLRIRVRTGIKVLAAVIDADTDPNARWEQVCTAYLNRSRQPKCNAGSLSG
jgi:hypothetical protein